MTEEQDKNQEVKEELTKKELAGFAGSGPSRSRASGLANPIIGEVPAPNYSLSDDDLEGIAGGSDDLIDPILPNPG